MQQELIIGRSRNSALKVPDDRVTVSSKHVRLTVGEEGSLKIEDLDSPNGTYIRNEEGGYERVYSKNIKDTDVIRLGNGGANSYSFTARRALHPHESYAFEFRQLRKHLEKSKEEEQKKEKIANITGWIISSGAIVAFFLTWIISKIIGVPIQPESRMFVMMGFPVIFKLLLSSFTKAPARIKKKRKNFMFCPNPECWRPISEYDIEQGQCPKCKAK